MLDDALRGPLRRIYPTAASIVRHTRLARRGPMHAPLVETTLSAFDAQGRALFPLRPEEMPELQDALTLHHGDGLLVLTL